WIGMYTKAVNSQALAEAVREGCEQMFEMGAGLVQAGSRALRPDADYQMMAVALVGAGEAMANRLSIGDIDVDEAAQLMIDLFWHGLRGGPEDREAAAEAGGSNAAAG